MCNEQIEKIQDFEILLHFDDDDDEHEFAYDFECILQHEKIDEIDDELDELFVIIAILRYAIISTHENQMFDDMHEQFHGIIEFLIIVLNVIDDDEVELHEIDEIDFLSLVLNVLIFFIFDEDE